MAEIKKVEKESRKSGRTTSYFINFLLIAVVLILLFNCFSIFRKMSIKKSKFNELKAQYEQALIQKNEYEYLLDEDNQLEYIERIAREKYGYVSPYERAFYDSSLGK